jgi:hypothetical protein
MVCPFSPDKSKTVPSDAVAMHDVGQVPICAFPELNAANSERRVKEAFMIQVDFEDFTSEKIRKNEWILQMSKDQRKGWDFIL